MSDLNDLNMADVGPVPDDHHVPSVDSVAVPQDVTAGGLGGGAAPGADAEPPAAHVSFRALIMSPDASIIIGKGGQHISEIRQESGARVAITPSAPGNQERILTVSGPLDAASRAFGLIVRRINDEPFLQPSLPGSHSYNVRLIVPNSRMGSIIGKAGSKIKEIQEASGARLQAGEAMLPGSTERMLSIAGVADAVHIAVYYVGLVLVENQERGTSANIQYRPGASASPAAFGAPFYPGAAPGAAPGGAFVPGAAPGAPGGPRMGLSSNQPPPPGSQTQQIFIPDDLVGSVIGKGGSKINEIRNGSGTHVKISDAQSGVSESGTAERLVTITGPPPNIQIAIAMLHQRVEEERQRLSNPQV